MFSSIQKDCNYSFKTLAFKQSDVAGTYQFDLRIGMSFVYTRL